MTTWTEDDWHRLHLRVARGETLAPDEQAFYETELRRLHSEESYPGDMAAIRQLYAEIRQMEAEVQQLRERKAKLDAQIAALEMQLSEPTRQMLLVGN